MPAEVKISELDDAGAISGAELLVIVQGGQNKKISLEDIGKLANDFQSENFLTTSATPGITPGPGAGAGPTLAIEGNNASGTVTLTTGTASGSGILFIITLDTYNYPLKAVVTITPGDADAAGIMDTLYTGGTANTVTVSLSSAPTDATQYIFKYAINGY